MLLAFKNSNGKRAKALDYITDTLLYDEILIIAIIIGFFLILAFFINFFIPFKKERDYIKMEMARSYDEDEYRYWRRELKYLYLRSIPLIGRFFR